MSIPVALVLGYGPRVGASVAAKFASSGYHVAVVSRKGTGKKTPEGYLSLQADFAEPETIGAVFDAVRTELKAAPRVVVYNAAAYTMPPDKESILSVSADKVVEDFKVNTVTPYVAAQHAIAGWETLPAEEKKTFILTGNILNMQVWAMPLFLTPGMGKSASAYWVGAADQSYMARGYRFFYVDERKADGQSAGGQVDGPAHGEFFERLAAHEGDIPWHATFVKGKGYMKF